MIAASPYSKFNSYFSVKQHSFPTHANSHSLDGGTEDLVQQPQGKRKLS